MNAPGRASEDADQGTDRFDVTRLIAPQQDSGADLLAPGTRVGRYRIEGVLGRGGMGQVLLAEQTEPVRRHVALKLVRRARTSALAEARFQLERQVLAQLSHPGIAQLYDAGSAPDGAAWFAMEHVAGQRLDQWWLSSRPSVDEALALFVDLCRAVGHAHRRGIVHCDLKPANLLVTEVDGRCLPKVIDFGIARAIGQDDPGHAGGTPAYISPEQAGGVAEIDARSDVHALGAILREGLTGQRLRPWVDAAQVPVEAAFVRVAGERRRADSESALAGLPLPGGRRRELAAILDRAIASDPAARYEDAHALADELQRWLDQQPVLALPASLGYRWRCRVRRHRLATGMGVLLALLVAGFSWQLWRQYGQTLAERDTAEQMVAILLETYTAADPVEFPGGTANARDLLAGAAERLQRRGLPTATRARLLQALGGVQLNLELYEDARASLSAALAEAHLLPTAQQDELVLQLARTELDAENFAAAHAHLAAVSGRHGPDHPASVTAQLIAADLAVLEGELATAESILEALRGAMTAATDRKLRHDWSLQRARLADARGDYADALAYYRAALSEAEALWGEADLRTLTVLNDLAIAIGRTGEHTQAVSVLERVANATEAAWGSSSAGLATVYGNLGAALMRADRAAQAEAWHRRAVAIFETRLGADSMHTGTEYNNLAASLDAQGRSAEALEWFDRAEHSLSAALGPRHLRVGITLHNQAKARLALGQIAEADALLARSGEILAPVLGQEHPRWMVYSVTRAQAQLARGQFEVARQALQEALPVLQSAFGDEHRDSQRAQVLLALALAASGDCDQAQALLDQWPDAVMPAGLPLSFSACPALGPRFRGDE